MEQWIKFFPLLPEYDDTTGLVVAILFYLFVPGIVVGAVDVALVLTVVLSPAASILSLAGSAYTICGIIFAVMRYMGKEIR